MVGLMYAWKEGGNKERKGGVQLLENRKEREERKEGERGEGEKCLSSYVCYVILRLRYVTSLSFFRSSRNWVKALTTGVMHLGR